MIHRYVAQLRWSGSTASGYRDYSRAHLVQTPPAAAELAVSADPSFLGDRPLQNPEQLLLAAAASCQMLSFLALAARARVDVLGYRDEAEALMPVTRGPMRITTITLRPEIVVADGVDLERVSALVAQAHEECYIANTLNAEIVIEPEVSWAAAQPSESQRSASQPPVVETPA
ncbi:organic hydroperoxide reductase OsmC/OhrA [Jatrophihabitans sp. GAS493]|uniref:OsmC family protein n=1 Tax=Jatrophihabitans sp. GAS493 TaxID=1907575 RepID=UPI000BB73234|nr:OsmC family protein [Jatrophihabitans sp. GAS493]SOD70999.1 organic hydroperoxide reductase OsmC/OhrA [Jatrophihabitans sp. GAS493]